MVKSAIKSPYTLPVLPRTSSAISGFFFCGIIDEPVVKASDSSINLNSKLCHRTISSAKRERCIIKIDRSERSSNAKSRSDTPSSEFSQTPESPRVCASKKRSVLKVVPASAQEPMGEISVRLAQSPSRSISLSSIKAYAIS